MLGQGRVNALVPHRPGLEERRDHRFAKTEFAKDLSALAKSAMGVDVKRLAVILEEAMAGTDCGACQYPTCEEYSVAIAKGECTETFRCEPGGADSAIEAEQIVLIHRGHWDTKKAEAQAKKAAAG